MRIVRLRQDQLEICFVCAMILMTRNLLQGNPSDTRFEFRAE